MFKLDDHLVHITWITVLGGIAGGFVSYVIAKSSSGEETDPDTKTHASNIWWHYVVMGMAASSCVPLFLSTIQSNLIEKSKQDATNFFIYGGICLIAAISAKKFLNVLTTKTLSDLSNEVDKVKEATRDVKSDVKSAKETADIAVDMAVNGVDRTVNAQKEEKSSVTIDQDLEEALESSLKANEQVRNILKGNIEQVRNILKEFSSSSVKYRTVEGISESLKLDAVVVETILEVLEKQKYVKKRVLKGPPKIELWFHN